jgi:type II secretory pathway pseudopilin PulG
MGRHSPCGRTLDAVRCSLPVGARRLHPEAGYTLIEVLTILAVLGIVTALAAPRIDFQRYQIDGAMQAVGSTLLAAQRTAVQAQHNVVVAFDVDSSRVRVHADGNNNLEIDGGEAVRLEPLGESVRFGRGGAPSFFSSGDAVSFSTQQGGLPAVVFYRNGAASEEGGFHLTSARATANPEYSRDTRALRIERATGRPAWFRQQSSSWKQEF